MHLISYCCSFGVLIQKEHVSSHFALLSTDFCNFLRVCD